MPVDLPLPPPPLVVSSKQVQEAYASNYFEGGRKFASSREQPAFMPDYPLGTWQVDDLRLERGHELSVLVEFAPRDLEPGEFDWADPRGTYDRGKQRDIEQYAKWLRDGLRAPPITVVETDRSTLRVVDGHRRLLAAEALGEEVLAWLGPMIKDPDGARDSAGHHLLVPLTYEIATGQEYVPLTANRRDPRRTPAKPHERVRGSRLNEPGSATREHAQSIVLSPGQEAQIRAIVNEHNARMRRASQRTTVAAAAAVMRRGMGAFSKTHHPSMDRSGWGRARLAHFLYLLEHGRPRNRRYVSDFDLLPAQHPKATRGA